MGALFRFFRSRFRIFVSDADGRAAVRFLAANNIPFHDLSKRENGIVFYLYPAYYKRYLRERGGALFDGEARTPLGLSALLYRYRHRLGLLIGGVLALMLLIFSSLFLWDIRISGTETIPNKAILDALSENGVRLGAYIPAIDTEHIEGELLLAVDGLSWISLNLRGTVLWAEVRERQDSGVVPDAEAPSNLIAEEDGQLVRFEVTGGVAVCRTGETVKKGHLLVSGVIDSPALGTRLVRARGEVFARVSRVLTVHIPYETEEKVYTGREITKKTLKIFSKSIKLFGKDSISGITCDKIESERRLTLFDKIKLPLFLSKTVYAEYELLPKLRTEEEAIQLAERVLSAKRTEAFRGAEVLHRDTAVVKTDSGITLCETADLLRNIAREIPIEKD